MLDRKLLCQKSMERYETAIGKEDSMTSRLVKAIQKLETKESSMLTRLHQTKTEHNLILDDFEKICSNQMPDGPLMELKTVRTLYRDAAKDTFRRSKAKSKSPHKSPPKSPRKPPSKSPRNVK
jgi:hypothetical protein